MKAGRELDALIAEQVLNWKEKWAGIDRTVPPYSTDIATAWQVVEKMRGAGYAFEMGTRWSGPGDIETASATDTYAQFWTGEPEDGLTCDFGAGDAPLAICLAALKALEVQP